MARFCPVCKTPVEKDLTSPVYPFCSKRCREIDLGSWLSSEYRISENISESDGIETGIPEEEIPEDS